MLSTLFLFTTRRVFHFVNSMNISIFVYSAIFLAPRHLIHIRSTFTRFIFTRARKISDRRKVLLIDPLQCVENVQLRVDFDCVVGLCLSKATFLNALVIAPKFKLFTASRKRVFFPLRWAQFCAIMLSANVTETESRKKSRNERENCLHGQFEGAFVNLVSADIFSFERLIEIK